jgi:hypothetical protein
MATREEEFEEVRRQLGYPLPNRPNSLEIVSELIRVEQSMYNRLAREGWKGWSPQTTTFTTADGESDYVVNPVAQSGFGVGPVLYAFRDLGDGVLLPVPKTDYGHGRVSPAYEFYVAPTVSDTTAGGAEVQGMKLAFWRTGGDTNVRVFPTPAEAMTITVEYAPGELDGSEFSWGDVPALPQFSALRVSLAARQLVSRCEWAGRDPGDSAAFRRDLRADCDVVAMRETPVFEAHIRNPDPESISDIGNWYD